MRFDETLLWTERLWEFVAAIRANPDDPAPRLVFADWLTDHGDEDFAQFLRDGCNPNESANEQLWEETLSALGLQSIRAIRQPALPRVDLRYSVEFSGGPQPIRIPFSIGVLADLSGPAHSGAPPPRDRQFVTIDRDNFDQVLQSIRPRLELRVPNRLVEDDSTWLVSLTFERFEDFEPANLAARIPPVADLLEVRRRSGFPTTDSTALEDIDTRLSRQLSEIIHHDSFRRLEGTWRGLRFLTEEADTGDSLRIDVLDVSKQELIDDFESAVEFDTSILFRKVHDERYRFGNVNPFGLLIGDFELGRTEKEIELLEHFSHIAAASHAPFVAGACPEMFGVEHHSELLDIPDLVARFEGEEYDRWRAFRQSEDSCFVALTVPRVPARPPYRSDPGQVDEFEFVELDERAEDESGVWMSAAWVFATRVADSYSRHGWFAGIRGVGDYDPPTRPTPLNGVESILGPTRRSFDLVGLGFLPLIRIEPLGSSFFLTSNSCREPNRFADPVSTLQAKRMADLDSLMCVSMFLEYLIVQRFDVIDGPLTKRENEDWFRNWIDDYCRREVGNSTAHARAEQPLLEADVVYREIRGRPGQFGIGLSVRPHYQYDEPHVPLHVFGTIPNHV